MRPIPDFPGYLATEDGRIYSEKTGKYLKPRYNRYGYQRLNLTRGGEKHTVLVHQVIAETFFGPAEGRSVLHGPKGQTDNSVSNLRYGTQTENIQDLIEFGNNPRSNGWKEGYVPLLSMNDVREIAEYVADGVSDQKIAHWYCIPVWSVQPVSWYEPGSYRLLVMTGSDFLEADGESAVA